MQLTAGADHGPFGVSPGPCCGVTDLTGPDGCRLGSSRNRRHPTPEVPATPAPSEGMPCSYPKHPIRSGPTDLPPSEHGEPLPSHRAGCR